MAAADAVAAIRPVDGDKHKDKEEHDVPQVMDPSARSKPPSIGARMMVVAGHAVVTSRPSTPAPIATVNYPAILLRTPVTI